MPSRRTTSRQAATAVPLAAMLYLASCAAHNPVPLRTDYPTEPVSLPRDLAAHPWAPIEWWYYTGHLTGGDGHPYAYELTFFLLRVDLNATNDLRSKWFGDTALMGHFAVVDEISGRYVHRSRFKPAGARATASSKVYDVRLMDWTAQGDLTRHHVSASDGQTRIELALTPEKPVVAHGHQGIVDKGGHANHYFSFTRMKTAGTLTLDGQVIPVTGTSWFDREFGYMGVPGDKGWDWYSLRLEDGTDFMIYTIRTADGRILPASQACRISRESVEECIPLSEAKIDPLGVWVSPHTGGIYPSSWHLRIPKWAVDLVIVPTVVDQEFTYRNGGPIYWEGSCRVLGHPSNGKGYVELVGYAKRRPRR